MKIQPASLPLKSVILLICLSLFHMVSKAQLNGTYTINKTGSGSKNYTSFRNAVQDLTNYGVNGPVVFNVSNGKYNESIMIPAISGASATNTITFQSKSLDSSKVIIDTTWWDTVPPRGYTVALNGANWIILHGITISNSASLNSTVVYLLSGAANNVIENCLLKSVKGGFTFGGCAVIYNNDTSAEGYNIIRHNHISGSYNGISFTDSRNSTEFGNVLYSNKIDNCLTGITAGAQDSFIIESNKISCYSIGIVFGNTLVKPKDSIFISNNFISVIGMAAAFDITQATMLNIYNNSIFIKVDPITSSSGAYTFYFRNLKSDIINIKNNIIFNAGTTTNPISLNYPPTSSDYNNIYCDNWAGYTFTQWKKFTGLDKHSISVNPQFTDSIDLHVKNDSLNAGIYLPALPNDIDGQQRHPKNPTIGAEEIAHKATSCMSGIYTIGHSGADDYSSFKSAIADLTKYGVCGPVVFKVEDGTYSESMTFHSISGISSTNTIDFESVSHDSTKVTVGKYGYYSLYFDSIAYITFKGMTINNGSITITYSKNINISNCVLISTSLRETNSSNLLINNNSGAAMQFTYGNNNVIENNSSFYLNLISQSGFIVRNNFNGSIIINQPLDSGLITKNVVNGIEIHNLGAPAGGIKEAKDLLITNNLVFSVYNSNHAGYFSTPATLLNNTFIMHCSVGGYTWYSSVQACEIASDSVVCYNNLFVGDSTTAHSLAAKAIFVDKLSIPYTSLKFDYNDYYAIHLGHYINSNIDSLSQWIDSTHMDSHSVSINPKFHVPFITNGAYSYPDSIHSVATNDSLNVGLPLASIHDDINGRKRDLTHPTIGSQEISVVPTKGAVAGFTASKFCKSDSTIFTDTSHFYGTDSINKWQWYFGDGNTSTLKNTKHHYSTGGTYTAMLKVFAKSGSADSAYQTIFIDSTCVWPGDANYDKVANKYDLLNIGVAYGYAGFSRPSASSNWFGQAEKDWRDTFASGVNFKQADCNGDGSVDSFDVIPIRLNYGYTHSKKSNLAKGGPNDPVLSLKFPADSIQSGQTVAVKINFGTIAIPADSVYGVAFTLTLDSNLIDTSKIGLDFSTSWLGNNKTLIHLVKEFRSNGYADIAISRIDHKNLSGFGQIGTLNIVIKDDISGKRHVTDRLRAAITEAKVIQWNEKDIPLNVAGDSMVVYQDKTGIANAASLGGGFVNVYPNPARDAFTIEVKNIKLSGLKIMDELGQTVWQATETAGKVNLSSKNMHPGIYFLQAITENGIYSKKIIILQ